VVGLLAGRFVFRLALANLPAAFLWAVLSGVVMLLLASLIQTLASSQRGGNMLTNVILFPLIMLGGSFFPFEAMPSWLAAAGKLTPNGWMLVQLKSLLGDTQTGAGLLVHGAAVLGVGVLLYAAVLLRLRRFGRAS
jgi:ABC-type multidrug transport system permease subunit